MKGRLCILGCIIGLSTGFAAAQLPLTKVNFVSRNYGHGWYQDTVKKELWLHNWEGWQRMDFADVEEVVPCGGLVTVKSKEKTKVWNGSWDIREELFTQCGDSFLGTWNGYVFAFMRTDSAHLMQFPSDRQGRCWIMGQGLDTLQGRLGACVAPHSGPGNQIRCEEFTAWGMMGMDGRWLIAPDYDAPFHFKNGIAEVLYYGQKRKINEKGEFVE